MQHNTPTRTPSHVRGFRVMDTLGFTRLRDDQSRGPEREHRRAQRHPSSLYAYPTDAPFRLALGDIPPLRDCPVPISLYRAATLDAVEQPIIVERYYAGVMGYLYPIRLKTIAYDRPTQTFANLPGLNALFSGISPPGEGQTIRVRDPVYALQDQAFQTPLIPDVGTRLCPDSLVPNLAHARMEELLRLKSQSDAKRRCDRLKLHIDRLIEDTLQNLRPQLSLKGSHKWGDAQTRISAKSASTRMAQPGQGSQVRYLMKTDQQNLLAYSPSAAAPVADAIDRLPLTDFSLTVHYEERTPLTRVWNNAGDRYWPFLVDAQMSDCEGNLRRALIDERMTEIALQVTAIVSNLLEDQSLYLGGLSESCRTWIHRADFLRGPYAVTVDKSHFGEARLTYCPIGSDGIRRVDAAFSVHLDLPFMALSCASLAVERI